MKPMQIGKLATLVGICLVFGVLYFSYTPFNHKSRYEVSSETSINDTTNAIENGSLEFVSFFANPSTRGPEIKATWDASEAIKWPPLSDEIGNRGVETSFVHFQMELPYSYVGYEKQNKTLTNDYTNASITTIPRVEEEGFTSSVDDYSDETVTAKKDIDKSQNLFKRQNLSTVVKNQSTPGPVRTRVKAIKQSNPVTS